MAARQRAQSRLDAALNAAGGPQLRDECEKPRQPVASPASRPLVTTKVERSLRDLEKKEKAAAADAYDTFLLGAAAEDAPAASVVPVQSLIDRRQGLADRLETMQTEGLKARSMLREVEAMVKRAIDEELEEESVPSAAHGAKPSSAPNSARAALGGRLAPSRGPGGMSLGAPGPVSARASYNTALPGRSALYAAGAGAHASAEHAVTTAFGSRPPSSDGSRPDSGYGSRPASSGSGGQGGGQGGGVGPVDHADALKARRLQQCEVMEAQLTSMRGALDEDDASLGAAKKDNARLARRAADALSFSAEELAAEMELHAEADEEAHDAWEASMAVDLARARRNMIAARVALADHESAGSPGGSGSSSGSRAAAASRARREAAGASSQRRRANDVPSSIAEEEEVVMGEAAASSSGGAPLAWSSARHDLAAGHRERGTGAAAVPHTPPRLPGHGPAAGRRPALGGRGGGGRGRGPRPASEPPEVELR